MGRRRLLGAASMAGGSVAFALACGGSKSRSGTETGAGGTTGQIATAVTGQAAPGAQEQVKRGGTFTINNSSPRTLDPHFDTFPANTIVTNNTNN
jgi:hypothetical protein